MVLGPAAEVESVERELGMSEKAGPHGRKRDARRARPQPVARPQTLRCGYLVGVSSAEKDGDRDACPNCGARVESSISGPSEQLREATERRCPSCGKVLRRDIGGVWTVDEAAS